MELSIKEIGKDDGKTEGQEQSSVKEQTATKKVPHNYGPEIKRYGLVFATYLIIALIMFFPITANVGSLAPGTGGDTYQNVWGIWWVGYATLVVHTSIFHTNLLFWPVGANLVYQTFSPVAALLSIPFQVFGLVFAYNVLFFLGFVVSGICMFALARYITKETYGAFLAGLAFTFSGFHIIQSYSHIHLLFIGWIPLALLFFLKYLDGDGNIHFNAAMAGISFTLANLMASYELGVMTILLFIVVLCAYLISKEKRKSIKPLGLVQFGVEFAVVAFVIGFWAYLPMISTISAPNGLSTVNLLNTPANDQLWSDDILSFFLPSPYNGFFNGLSKSYSFIYTYDVTAQEAYIGYVVLALVLYELIHGWKKEKLWIGIAAIFLLLCLGPNIQIGGVVTAVPGLFSLYYLVPVLNFVREPGRFFIVAGIGLYVIAALGIKRLHEARSAPNQNWLAIFFVIIIIFLIENNGTPTSSQMLNQMTTKMSIPEFYTLLGQQQYYNASILSLPALPNQYSLQPNFYPGLATYYSTASKKPLVGGYTTRENETQLLTLYNIPLAVQATELEENITPIYQSPVNQSTLNESLLTMYNYDVGIVTLNKQAYEASVLPGFEDYLAAVFGNPIYNDNTTIAFSTQNAITQTLFNSFVAYPSLVEWGSTTAFINGTSTQLWSPINGSAMIIVYAPYKNASVALQARANPQSQSFVNTTISFDAVAASTPAQLEIYEVGSTQSTKIAIINITSKISQYNVYTREISGPYGNVYAFVTPSAQIGITNIHFK
jgi:hypothetical protein